MNRYFFIVTLVFASVAGLLAKECCVQKIPQSKRLSDDECAKKGSKENDAIQRLKKAKEAHDQLQSQFVSAGSALRTTVVAIANNSVPQHWPSKWHNAESKDRDNLVTLKGTFDTQCEKFVSAVKMFVDGKGAAKADIDKARSEADKLCKEETFIYNREANRPYTKENCTQLCKEQSKDCTWMDHGACSH